MTWATTLTIEEDCSCTQTTSNTQVTSERYSDSPFATLTGYPSATQALESTASSETGNMSYQNAILSCAMLIGVSSSQTIESSDGHDVRVTSE